MSLSNILSNLTSLPYGFASSVPFGLATIGTLPTVPLVDFLPGSTKTGRAPWTGFDPASTTPPSTAATRKYDWTITRSYINPDGFNKSVILINGQYPGPTLEANWGDQVEVTVHNNIGTDSEGDDPEGVSLHWHGLTQIKTPWMDGVPGVSQCPIAPGSTFKYSFQADQYGTSWYHSHYSAQYTDGLVGPMVVHGPSNAPYDVDIGPVMMTEWLHESYYLELQNALKPAPPSFPIVDNNLINGKGIVVCDASSPNCDPTASVAKFNFSTGKTHRLRLINYGGAANQKFSIDNHTMTVIANDFVPIVPYTTNVVTLAPGQRSDVLVKGTGKPTDAVWMRSDIDVPCLNTTATIATALAAVYYQNANQTTVPKTSGYSWESNACRNDPLSKTIPQYPQTPSKQPGTSQTIEIDAGLNGTAQVVFFVDGSSFRVDYNSPVLLAENNGTRSFPTERNVYDFGSNSSVRLIVKNTFSMMHAMHLHGHNYWVLAEGYGDWDGTVTNAQNPQRRDVQVMAPGSPENPSYIVLQWNQDNPGVWPFHCHMAVHVSEGLYINVVERPADIQKDMQIPPVMAQTCTDWQAWTSKNFVDQIDSGV